MCISPSGVVRGVHCKPRGIATANNLHRPPAPTCCSAAAAAAAAAPCRAHIARMSISLAKTMGANITEGEFAAGTSPSSPGAEAPQASSPAPTEQQQPVVEQKPADPAPLPVVEKPADPAPVVEKPADPAPVVQPAAAAGDDPFSAKTLDLSKLPTIFQLLTEHAAENTWSNKVEL